MVDRRKGAALQRSLPKASLTRHTVGCVNSVSVKLCVRDAAVKNFILFNGSKSKTERRY